jgi:hypothetical protein
MYALMNFESGNGNDRFVKVVDITDDMQKAQLLCQQKKLIHDTYVIPVGQWTQLPHKITESVKNDPISDPYSSCDILELFKKYEGLSLDVLEKKMDKMMDKLVPDHEKYQIDQKEDDFMTITI